MELEKNRKMNEPEKRVISAEIEIREAEQEGGARTITGSIKYNSISRVMRDWSGEKFVEVIAPGAFDEYLRSMPTVALWCHKDNQILGNTRSGTLKLINSQEELRFENEPPNNSVGNDAWENVRRGDVDGVSFGFNVLDGGDKWEKVDHNGEQIFKRTVLKATLPEISLTPFAAYPENGVSVRSLDEFKAEEQRTLTEHKKRILALELDLI